MPKNTSNAQFGQVLSEIWPAEVFWSQNSCGRAQTGRDARQRKQVAPTGPGHAQTGRVMRQRKQVARQSK